MVRPCFLAPLLSGTTSRFTVLDLATPRRGIVLAAGVTVAARNRHPWLRGRWPQRRWASAASSKGNMLPIVQQRRASGGLSYPEGAAVDDVFVESLIREQRANMGKIVLRVSDASRLVTDTTALLRDEKTLGRAEVDTIIVVGDLHGQYHDLLRIFELAGPPTPENPYLFNGDFVDRGAYSLEVVFTIFALKLRYPGAIFLNRGNHESVRLNLRYGFADEISNRYGSAGEDLFEDFAEAFRWLPLAHVLNDDVFVVHGGLPGPDVRAVPPNIATGAKGLLGGGIKPKSSGNFGLPAQKPIEQRSNPLRQKDISLEYIASLPRAVEPVTDARTLQRLPKEQEEKHRFVTDLLWADPSENAGYSPSLRIESGLYFFGPDVTGSFLKSNGLNLVLRSHECKVDGYEWSHPSLVTVFSAANYLGCMRNKGAVTRLTRSAESGHLEPSFLTWESTEEAAPPRQKAARPKWQQGNQKGLPLIKKSSLIRPG